ncbi:uncharacterized protein LOC124372648 [Homalodisca vitripennis]|uniref:uncharacterized protein LOC124372648 n=1 Tax=Homalodisca vitripennis TaxID=197043 RepID=UPI001EEAA49C|nr:uncharacterized protein LOC124372648 [Homalodisca vitripennis]
MLLVLVMVCYLLEIAHSDSCLGVYNDLVYDFKKGESWSNIGQCLLHRCKGDNQVIVERCPNVTLHRGCTLSKEDSTKYFPGCCPYPLCDETEAVMCVDAQDRSRHAPGDQWQPSGECVHKECVGGGLTLVSKCTINQLPPGCSYLEFDLSLNFPKCCPRVVCGNKTEESEE